MSEACVIPRICAELREYHARKYGGHDPVIERLTTQMEVYSSSEAVSSEWFVLGLTTAERRIMSRLTPHPGMTFSKGALLDALYFDRTGDEPDVKIVDVFICKIRKKLVAGNAQVWIATSWGMGYRLTHESAIAAHKKFAERRQFPIGEHNAPSRSAEWRDGVLLGVKQASLAEVLHSKLGQWVSSRELADTSGVHRNSITEQLRWVSIRVAAYYAIERRIGFGYRMVRASSDTRAA